MYESKLNVRETEQAIKILKDKFEQLFASRLNLIRVSAPLLVDKDTGLNDNLNGIEKPMSFQKETKEIQIVQSLAKWKRMALYRYGFSQGEGIYTDMNAIRPDEELSPIHSYYVDQWDWEKIIQKEDRQISFLKQVVEQIFLVLKQTDYYICSLYPMLQLKLPEQIYFISSQELEDKYPNKTPKQREHEICLEKKAVFVYQIGDVLLSKQKHDGRSPDYDDWRLNGDILVWDEVIKQSLELSSMGIRVDAVSMKDQLAKSNTLDRALLPYHQMVLNNQLPLTIGGGIGQSRLCMFFLEKRHIGEVQSSYWPENIMLECHHQNIKLL
ncbi:MAG: aspartate--ammonia ligase [Bacilli bacterium]|nr:aspartate--ammonia ligase [Bacilli bacterium]